MKKFILTVLKVVAFFISFVLIAVVIPVPETSSSVLWRLYAELIPLMSVVVLTFIFLKIEKGEIAIPIGENPIKISFLSFTIGLLWIGAAVAVFLATGVMKIESINIVPLISVWILSAFLNVAMQEFLCRGYIYQLIKTKYNLVSAIICTTVLFVGLHPGAFEGGVIPILNVMTMSFFMVAVLEYYGSIIAPIVIHAVWNIVSCIIFDAIALPSDYPHLLNTIFRGNNILSGGDLKMEGSIIVLILNLLLTSIFIFLIINKKTNSKSDE